MDEQIYGEQNTVFVLVIDVVVENRIVNRYTVGLGLPHNSREYMELH